MRCSFQLLTVCTLSKDFRWILLKKREVGSIEIREAGVWSLKSDEVCLLGYFSLRR